MAKARPPFRRSSASVCPHHSLSLTISSRGARSNCSRGRSVRRSVRRMSGMGLCDDVRRHCATVAASARWVEIDIEATGRIEPGPEPELDRERHYLDGSPQDVAAYMLT